MAKKNDFRPDKMGPGLLDKLYLTARQRRNLLKWVLYSLVLLTLSILQDVIFCRLRVLGASTELVPCGIVLICLMEGAERGSVFTLVAALLYLFSGSAHGFYAVPVLVALALGVTIFQQSFLQKEFSTAMLCVAVALLVYELSMYVIGLVISVTRPDRILGFLITAGITLPAAPILYPLIRAIGNIGGETWIE